MTGMMCAIMVCYRSCVIVQADVAAGTAVICTPH